MLQRIQTVWLFFATASLFCLFLFPFIQFVDAANIATAVKATGVYQNLNGQVMQTEAFIGLTIATVIVGLVPFVIIFFYRDRKKQITISYITILLILAYTFWMAQTAKQAVDSSIQLQIENYGIGVILPSLAILFIILALRGIRKDEKLVRSADRLR